MVSSKSPGIWEQEYNEVFQQVPSVKGIQEDTAGAFLSNLTECLHQVGDDSLVMFLVDDLIFHSRINISYRNLYASSISCNPYISSIALTASVTCAVCLQRDDRLLLGTFR